MAAEPAVKYNLEIQYCVPWDYSAEAVSLTRKLLAEFQPDISVRITPSDGGRFEIILNGKLIYSKYETGRFPNPQEVIKSIKSAA